MKYTPKYIRKTLKKTISEISLNPQAFSKYPEKDFSRTRKLPFEKVVNSVLSMSCKDLKCELMDIFEFDDEGNIKVNNEQINDENIDEVNEAMNNCPVGAISEE